MFVYIILYAILLIIHPSVAHAWGPGTHIEIAFTLLEQLALAAPAVRAVVAGREEWFLYGSVAADIVVGKKFAGKHDHCHNWTVGLKVLRAARTDREKAAAYGYLSHLAADVVAHNYYVPYKTIERYNARLLSHTYWEMLFDMHVRPKVWDEMMKVIVRDYSPFDRLLERVLKQALFSFKTSKHIFSGILALQRLKYFRKMALIYSKKTRFKLDIDEVTHYMRLALFCAGEYLINPETAGCLDADPVGRNALDYAKVFRRGLRKHSGRRRGNSKEISKIILAAKDNLYNGIDECLHFTQKP